MDIHIIANKTLQRSWITPGRRQLFHWFVSLVPAIHQMLIGHLTIQPTRARTLASVLQKKSDKMRRRARRVQIQVPWTKCGKFKYIQITFQICLPLMEYNKPDKPIPLDPMDRNAASLRPVLTLLGLKVIACSWPWWPLFKKFCHVGITMPCLPPITGNGEHTIAILWWWLGDGFHKFVLPTLPAIALNPKIRSNGCHFSHFSWEVCPIPAESSTRLRFCNPNPIWSNMNKTTNWSFPKNHPNFHHFFLLYTIPFWGTPPWNPPHLRFLQWNTPSLNFGALCLASELQRMGCKCLADDIVKWSPGNTLRIRKKCYLVVPWYWDTIRSDYGKCWRRDMNNEMKW